MNIWQKYILLPALLVVSLLSTGQIAVGQWRDHLPYHYGKMLTETDDKVFVVTNVGLFSYDKTNGELEKWSKVNGLSDAGVVSVGYSADFDILFIGYSNGNLDLVVGNTIINVPDIKRKSLTASKSINNFMFKGNYAYLSCGFGIVVFDLEKKEINSTYFIGQNGAYVFVNELASDGENLFAATTEGVYKGSLQAELVDFSNWQLITGVENGQAFSWVNGQNFNAIEFFAGKLIVNFKHPSLTNADTLLTYYNNQWGYFDNVVQVTNALTSTNDKLVVTSNYFIKLYNTDFENYHHVWSYNLESNSMYPQYAIIGRDNVIWIADRSRGLVKSSDLYYYQQKTMNGPMNYVFFEMAAYGNEVYGVGGGFNLSLTPTFNHSMLFKFSDIWETKYYVNETQMSSITDLVSVAINPSNPSQVYAGSWTAGLLEFNNFAFTNLYNNTNSPLELIPNTSLIRVGGLAFDQSNNLWITCSDNGMPIVVKMADGTWHGIDYGTEMDALNVRQIIVTQTGKKWVVLPRGGGLFVFDDKGTPANKSDDDYRKLSIVDEYGQIISNEVFSIAEDQNGSVWVGTNAGVVVYYNPDRVFENPSFYAQQIKIPRNDGTDDADILLGSETVTSIAVDGANRKWFGTQSGGVFLTSSDGITELHHFNTDNSPLLSNNIYSIVINPTSGEVFFGTEKGLISFRGEATQGGEDYEDVYTFPNPVPPGYNGQITIHGLVAGSIVKITDISGNLVTEMKSLGGQAVWDGNDVNGNRVASGVYLVFSANEDGSKKNITKILFLN
ncbi:MAG TPA: two-component regulator propeller domain-containing protein [Bacteroidales bacterium]|nr:two-component regulator propeller domain-containing protein [Bacteroidales bacterium]